MTLKRWGSARGILSDSDFHGICSRRCGDETHYCIERCGSYGETYNGIALTMNIVCCLAFENSFFCRDPDFVVAYNGVNFDNNFEHPCQNVRPGGFFLSRFAFRPARFRELNLSGEWRKMSSSILICLDDPTWTGLSNSNATSHKKSYKLDHFARKFCGDTKEPMSYKEIPILQAGTSKDRARLASYCVHDSYLLHLLNRKHETWSSRLSSFPVSSTSSSNGFTSWSTGSLSGDDFEKGTRRGSDTVATPKAPDGFCDMGSSSFQGATVNEPKKGFYPGFTGTLDWHSLYPSIMASFNMCHSTCVNDPTLFEEEGISRHQVSDTLVTHFVKEERHKGVMPVILEELGEEHTVQKNGQTPPQNRQEYPKDSQEYKQNMLFSNVYDGRQLAVKIAMNSMYGACGAAVSSGGKYPCVWISATCVEDVKL